jgi:hypothetical protein
VDGRIVSGRVFLKCVRRYVGRNTTRYTFLRVDLSPDTKGVFERTLRLSAPLANPAQRTETEMSIALP